MLEKLGFPFPLGVDSRGRIALTGGDEAIRGKIVQVLFTAPGERVHQPKFGCGLLNLVFEPNNDVLAAAMEFTVGQALNRWLKEDIVVDTVKVLAEQEQSTVQIVYTRKVDLARQAVQIQFR